MSGKTRGRTQPENYTKVIDVFNDKIRIQVAVPKIIIVPNRKHPYPQVRRERRNVFSDETNLFLLRILRGKTDLPDTLRNVTADNVSAVPRDLQLEVAAAIRQRLLPWFWSISLHTLLLFLLALILFQTPHFEPPDVLSGMANIPFPQEVPIHVPPGEGHVPSVDPAETNSPTQAEESNVPMIEPIHSSPGLDFSGRDPHLRAAMPGSGNGGAGKTDEAVLAGLHWLVRVQQPDGAWHFSGSFAQPASQRREDAVAATAMALCAFQGYGVTPDSNHPLLIEFARPVRRGWDWLFRQQNPDGGFYTPSASSTNRFYTHGLCTIALCELLAMTGDETLREPAQRGIDYCVRHQSIRRGGWRYLPDRFSEQSDVSVTGWIVLALKSGQAAGLTIPPETYNNVMKFLDSMMLDSTRGAHQYKYREEEPEPSISMTAEALFCRILLGWQRNDPRLTAGVQLILETPPSFVEHYQRDIYYWFFATQTLYHYGGHEWQTWNSLMREQLLHHQERTGTELGSWHPQRPARDTWGIHYGRLYTTCMSLYILEAYYRHLQIFPEVP